MKVADIVNSVEVVNQIMQTKLKIGTSYKLKKIADEASTVLEQFNERRTELLSELGKPDDAGNYNFSDENAKKFDKVLNEYAGEEVELNFPKVSISELENVEIEPSKLGSISWFIGD